MDQNEFERKRARINELSEKISKYHDKHKNSNNVVGAIDGDEYLEWFREFNKLNKELGYN